MVVKCLFCSGLEYREFKLFILPENLSSLPLLPILFKKNNKKALEIFYKIKP